MIILKLKFEIFQIPKKFQAVIVDCRTIKNKHAHLFDIQYVIPVTVTDFDFNFQWPLQLLLLDTNETHRCECPLVTAIQRTLKNF